ncbi:MAG: DNA-binding protein [Erysipelotrichaceae bacterium]|nr:DNA-binding protein [Erysipelotrichaceae bacterium]
MLDKNKGNLLLDYYGNLLTKHQLSILDDYFKNDFSMNEIAENEGISKAAVSDLINRSIKQLENYENKLKLIKQAEKLDKIISELEKGDEASKKLANKLINIYRR